LTEAKPDVVIDTAAFHNVPVCETDAEASYRVNALGARNVAEIAGEVGASVVYISTDYVFDGAKQAPYVETDRECPLNVYGASKVAGEQLVRIFNPRHYVVRSTGLYGSKASGKGHTFPRKMLQLAEEKSEVTVVNDQFCTPTYTHDLAEQLIDLVETENFGTFHMTNEGSCSWFELTRHIFDLAKVKTPLLPVSSSAFPSTVKRPSYSVLENAHLKALGLNRMPHWKDSVSAYLKEVGVL